MGVITRGAELMKRVWALVVLECPRCRERIAHPRRNLSAGYHSNRFGYSIERSVIVSWLLIATIAYIAHRHMGVVNFRKAQFPIDRAATCI